MNSFYHLGSEKALQTWICGLTGWTNAALGGAALQMVIIVTLPMFYNWVQAGDDSVPEELREGSEEATSGRGEAKSEIQDEV